MKTFDVIIIGAGIAGASVASEMGDDARVLVLEREEQPGYHSTGRSAAAYIPSFGHDNPSLRLLTHHSLDFFNEPPDIFQNRNLLSRRGLLTVCPPELPESVFEQEFEDTRAVIPTVTWEDSVSIRQRIPPIRDEYTRAGWYEPDVYDIGVHELHEGYLRDVRHQGGEVVNRAHILTIERKGSEWQIETDQERFSAPLLVNAAGAWADEVATQAGVDTIGLSPMRRTAVLLDPPEGSNVSAWPIVMASNNAFYFKPDAGLIMASPADEIPSQPCDAQPEELDIATTVHLAQQALQLKVEKVKHSWAGLRNFVEDRTPVIGFAPDTEGFFWLAGQGGHGIQIAPTAARLAASLLLRGHIPKDLEQTGFDPSWVSPERLTLPHAVTANTLSN